MNNIAIVRETLNIIKARQYMCDGECIMLPDVPLDEVVVISPEAGNKLLNDDINQYMHSDMCKLSVFNSDSYQAARRFEDVLVMNFANAHCPGGGFLFGANAQEEALCRTSTLYSSLTSKNAHEMYKYNNSHASRVESDYMLLSPYVVVFRDEKCNLINDPKTLGVVTLPAPNRHGAALLASERLIEDTFLRRIRIMLLVAMKHGYKNLVLGAWGCGAFGNSPKKVAKYFYDVIVSEGYGKCFDEICFAIYGKEDSANLIEFKSAFL